MFPLLVVALLIAAGSDSKSVVLTGVVSDESCGATHLKAGDEQCVVKCLRGGASVGHPEWKPQRMVLVARDGSSVLFIANPERLKGRAGREVTILATAPGKNKTVRVLALVTK
jgi:hypothetical protein